MSAEPTVPPEREADAETPGRDRPVKDRAEQIVEQLSEGAVRFVRRVVARAREEAEDIVAEAQTIRRGSGRRE